MDSFTYLIPLALNHKRLQKKLPNTAQYRISFNKGEELEGVLLDTFDAEMFHSARMLFQVGAMLYYIDLQTGQQVKQDTPAGWSFTGDLPEGPVTALLEGVSRLRAFLPVAKVKLLFEHGLFLDDEGKTRARLHNLKISRGPKEIVVGGTQYLRGYGQAHTDLCRSLEKIGAEPCQDAGQVYEALGIDQEQYTGKPVTELNSDAPARESAQKIIKVFIQTARRNEKGIIADLDTEFLHDYRVSLRKVRSVLSLFKGVYSPEDTVCLKKDFASLMQKTNALRDLDVYLLNKSQYFDLVPSDTHEGLAILFGYFSDERKNEQKRVRKVLRSQAYRKEMNRLAKLFTDASVLPGGPNGEEHSLAFACRLILKRYDKVCKIARSIDSGTEDEVVHQLRINCKKLRYLMEFFAPLFPENDIKTLIKALKLLQDNLGNFNDYSVQQIFLRQVLIERMVLFGKSKLKVAESVGALTAILHNLQQKERRKVMKNFVRFDSPETRATFARLFTTHEPEKSIDENNSLLQ